MTFSLLLGGWPVSEAGAYIIKKERNDTTKGKREQEGESCRLFYLFIYF